MESRRAWLTEVQVCPSILAADFGVARSVMGFDPDGHVIEFELFTPGASGEPGFAPLDIDALRDAAVAVAVA